MTAGIGYLVSILCSVIILLLAGILRKVSVVENSVKEALKEANEQRVTIAERMTNRPTFDEFNARIKDTRTELCKKCTKIETDFRHHVHEGQNAKVVL